MSKHREPVREYTEYPSPFYTGLVIAAGVTIIALLSLMILALLT